MPGPYRVCRLDDPPAGARQHAPTTERCIDVVLVAGPNTVEPDFDATSATPVPAGRPLGWDYDRTFDHLPLLRNVAELFDRATEEQRTTTRGLRQFTPRPKR